MGDILVTGGTGFVGYWLMRECPSALSWDVLYLGKDDYEKGLFGWKDASVGKFSHIVHAAPIAPTEVLKIAKRDNARVLYVSSGIVYHPENDTEYRQNKIKWEQECLDSGVDVVIARLFTFYGEKLDEHKAYTQFKNAAEKGEPLRIWGDGKTIRSYMHGAEMARWMWGILLHGESGQAYDVGDDAPVTILELAQQIKQDVLREQYPNPDERNGIHQSEIIIENRVPDPVPVYLPVDTAKTKRLLEKM